MPRPETEIHTIELEHLCWSCQFYTFKVRAPEDTAQGWAFCRKRNNFFPRQGPELPKDNPNHLPAAGMRTCGHWK